MALYCGIDLHARSSYVAIVDEQRKRIFKRNLQNDPKLMGLLPDVLTMWLRKAPMTRQSEVSCRS